MGLDQYLFGKDGDGQLQEVAYWRKANAIHRWFVYNVQNGIDECQLSPVTRQQLDELLEICYEVIQTAKLIEGHVHTGSHVGPGTNGEWVEDYEIGDVIENPEEVANLLPTMSGFFFGSTAYDKFYLNDVKDTIEQLQKVLKLEFKEFFYQSSW
jgi:hypothetical protein